MENFTINTLHVFHKSEKLFAIKVRSNNHSLQVLAGNMQTLDVPFDIPYSL